MDFWFWKFTQGNVSSLGFQFRYLIQHIDYRHLENKIVKKNDYGGPLAILKLSQFVKTSVLVSSLRE